MPKVKKIKLTARQNRIVKRRKTDFKSSDWYSKAASSISAAKGLNSEMTETDRVKSLD